jgi:hypothetical protein
VHVMIRSCEGTWVLHDVATFTSRTFTSARAATMRSYSDATVVDMMVVVMCMAVSERCVKHLVAA